MKKMMLLSFLFILCSCKELVGQNQEEMNNKAIALLGNLYQDVQYLDKKVSYHAVVSSGAATVEVYINGYPIHREPAVVGKSGSKSGSTPINKYILQSGEQHWEVRVYPSYNTTPISLEREISKNARFIVRLEKLRFTDVGVETLAEPIVLIETPMNYESDNSGNVEEVYKDAGKPMMVYKGTFTAQVPYVLDGWSKSVDLTQENSETLQKELVEKYKELWKMLDERRTGDFAEKIVKREKETAQALFYTKDLNDDYMETFFDRVDKKDKKIAQKLHIQGAYFSVYIDPFWSFEANDFIEGPEIEIFPTVSGRNIKSTAVLKTATLKVASNGKLINPNLDRSNKPILVGEVDANYADFYHCRYDTILFSEKGKAPVTVFDSKNPNLRTANPILVDVIAGEKTSYFIDFDFQTVECEIKPEKHSDKEIILTQIPKGYEVELLSGGKVDNNVKIEKYKIIDTSFSTKTSNSGASSTNKELLSTKNEVKKVFIRKNQVEFEAAYSYDIPNNNQAGALQIFDKALQYFWLPDLGSKVQHLKLDALSCAFSKNLDIAIYPDIKWTLKLGFNVTKEYVEALNKRGLKTPLGIFEAFEDQQEEWDKEAEKKRERLFGQKQSSKKNTK